MSRTTAFRRRTGLANTRDIHGHCAPCFVPSRVYHIPPAIAQPIGHPGWRLTGGWQEDALNQPGLLMVRFAFGFAFGFALRLPLRLPLWRQPSALHAHQAA